MLTTLLVAAPGYFALFALIWLQRQKDAPKTQKRPAAKYVTHDDLDEAIEKVTKKLEWEWTEMYEKFNALHLRLAKRAQRARRVDSEEDQQHVEQEEQQHLPLSVLPYRRLGSP